VAFLPRRRSATGLPGPALSGKGSSSPH
jgi:hypothetical protein